MRKPGEGELLIDMVASVCSIILLASRSKSTA